MILDYKKQDLYQMAGQAQGGWKQVSPSMSGERRMAAPIMEPPAGIVAEPAAIPPSAMENNATPNISIQPLDIPTVEIPSVPGVPPIGTFPPMEILPPTGSMPPEENPCGFCLTPAMSYTPMQKWGETYEAEQGFHRGTIFPELDLPFVPEGGMNHGR